MPGKSDSGQVDDLKVHLEAIVAADTARQVAPDGESDEARRARESVIFRPRLRQRLEAAVADLGAQSPGLSAAEVAKLTSTRAGREALDDGVAALGRVDDHLQAMTGERNPLIGKSYGVHGNNRDTFGGVLRSLSMCLVAEATLEALPQDDEQRELLFTPVVKDAVVGAHAKMTAILGAKEAKRGDLSRSYAVKQATIDEAMAAVAAARQHLYANLPDRKMDRSLHDYGFRPIHLGRRPRTDGDAPAEEQAPSASA